MSKKMPNITTIASALTNATKLTILDSLMDGRGHTLLELAKDSNVTPQTASFHLKKFVELNWVRVEKSGRFHYFFLENEQVAELIEMFSPVSFEAQTVSMKQALEADHIRNFRSCYDHMAGHVGREITAALINHDFLAENKHKLQLTASGSLFFEQQLNIDIAQLRQQKRQFITSCLDWSERKYHTGGALGHALYHFFQSKYFVLPNKNVRRALSLTPNGTRFLNDILDVHL
ncbi:helix-turn-helix transcriptional regulator [Leuconostoc gelidum subsp. aenigmaticum]|uniref:ArsR/SmtB family transcription factor n=1 Tax=Leuconostoc gelidum TaxID=1244 RepID=UPI001CC5C854|nr:helix-turn-helix transcriptional regulator [Leuconostoc gelidum]MBZ6003844.1 helix-turn-helix transcriptional regulator [Leuconostoc gelidum subsp. aenigmaticum]